MNSETAPSETAPAADATNACSDCPICLEPIEGNAGCNWPGCSHRFCFNCVVTQVINTGIQNWNMRNVNQVANHVNCPLCRRNFRGDNVAPPTTGHITEESNIFRRAENLDIDMNLFRRMIGTSRLNLNEPTATDVNGEVLPHSPLNSPPATHPRTTPSHNPLNYPLPRSNAMDIEALTAEVQNLVQDADFDAFIRSAEPGFNAGHTAAQPPSMPINIANGRENFTPLNDGEMNVITEKLLGKFPHFQFQRISRNR